MQEGGSLSGETNSGTDGGARLHQQQVRAQVNNPLEQQWTSENSYKLPREVQKRNLRMSDYSTNYISKRISILNTHLKAEATIKNL